MMWLIQMVLIPVLLPTLVVRTIICDNNTDSDVFVKYSGHAEASYPEIKNITDATTVRDGTSVSPDIQAERVHILPPSSRATSTEAPPEESDGVLFVPNESPVTRLQDQYEKPLRLIDIIKEKTVDDVMDDHIHMDKDASSDTVFIASKNSDITEKNSKVDSRRGGNEHNIGEKPPAPRPAKLDCSNLDCNNTIESLCGAKVINHEIRYRLFLNECYFRKVNCNFKHEMNRYLQMSLDKCEKIGAHYQESSFSFRPRFIDEPKPSAILGGTTSFSSRRSMSMSMNGQFCSHPCPVSCPNHYDPECALSATGQRKVFMNHCKLDDNSCVYGVGQAGPFMQRSAWLNRDFYDECFSD